MAKRKPLGKDQQLKSRNGFTLIELVVAMAILFILIYMGFSAFSFTNTLAKANQNREVVLENISTVLDQMTKELRQTTTVEDHVGGDGNYGVTSPSAGTSRGLTDILASTSKVPPLGSDEFYTFDSSKDPILRFYTYDDAGKKHRISYTIALPTGGGINQQYWADSRYQPCEILYSNETGTNWNDGIHNQPITDQVITNFTVIRPSWSDKGKVIQIVIEAMMKDSSGKPVTITRIAQITLRQ